MLDDFTPLVHTFPNREDIVVYPISDVHVGSREFIPSVWEAFMKKVESEPQSYVTIAGDMMNNATKNSISNVYEDTMRPREQKQWVTEQLGRIKDKILCVVSGNHENRNDKEVDNNPLWDVCVKLGIEQRFRPNAAFMFMRFGQKNGDGNKNPTYSACVTHGSGGGIYTGATVNRNERFGYTMDGLDILVVGHSHKPALTKPQKIVVDAQNNKVSFKPILVVSSTAWTQYGGYALRKQLLPSSHALQEIHISGKEKKARAVM